MVVILDLHDVCNASSKISDLKLPVYKENGLKIEFGEDFNAKTIYKGPKPLLPFSASDKFLSSICDWRRLSADSENVKAVYEVIFDVEGSNFSFKAGDTIGILPQNRDEEVQFIIEHLSLTSQADLSYNLTVDGSQKGAKVPPHIPIQSSLRYVLKQCVDLRSIIKKLFLLAISKYTENKNEKKVLEFLCSTQGSDMYNEYVLNKNLCILDILKTFPSCKPPIEVLLANLPRLLPRPYSITNSGLKQANKLKICFSVMDKGNDRKGLTTGWLEDIILNKELRIEEKMKNLNLNEINCDFKIPIYLRKNVSGFSLPANLEAPLILIGPGTGVSPFIGFLEEIEIKKQEDPNKNFGCVCLYFGCRYPKLDFIYEEQLNKFLKEGTLAKLSTAFSRIENHDGIRYVQDALLADGKNIASCVEKGASIFVCGNIKVMASQIKQTILRCLTTYSDKTIEEAEEIIAKMEKDKKYHMDIWS